MLKTFSLENLSRVVTKYKWLPLISLGLIFLVLLFFRFPVHDETIYMQETWLMTESLKSGKWIGEYGVGLHGFLFKLPVALIFLITGPNVIVPTIFNYLIALASLFLMFKVSKQVLKSDLLAIASVILLAFSFEFVRSTPTYLRELPSLFSVLLFTYLYLKDEKKWKLGLSLLLILDAKEYMFFVIGFSYFLIQLTIFLKDGLKNINWKSLKDLFLDYVIVFSPSFLFIILMFTTSLVPVNMFLASLMGLIDKGLKWNASQFSTDLGTNNVVNSGDVKQIFQITYNSGIAFLQYVFDIVNTILNYIGKLLYPRSFSYTSIPRILILPVIFIGIFKSKKWLKNNPKILFLFINIAVFLVIFLLRNSHGRYLFSISPFIFILLTLFIFEMTKNVKMTIFVLTISWIVEVSGLYFETSQSIIKMFLSLVILFVFLFTFYISKKESKYLEYSTYLCVLLIGSISLFSSLYFSYSQGQIHESRKYGYAFESSTSSKILSNYDFVYINDNPTASLLPFMLRETYLNPGWKWNLSSKIPKSSYLKYYGHDRVKLVSNIPFEDLKSNLNSVLVIFDSKYLNDSFVNENTIPSLIQNPSFKLLEKIELKGKDMYIFDYNENTN